MRGPSPMTMAKAAFVGVTTLPRKSNFKENRYEWIWNGIWRDLDDLASGSGCLGNRRAGQISTEITSKQRSE